jgi:hypothetical protein
MDFMASLQFHSFPAWAGLITYLAGYWKSAGPSEFSFRSSAIREKDSPGSQSHAFPVAG